MIDLIIIDLLALIKNQQYPNKLLINRNDYSILERELEKSNVDRLFNMRILITKTERFKLR